jgi:hypothetical protein
MVHIPSSSTAADSNSVQMEPHVTEVAINNGGEAESTCDSTRSISIHPEAAVGVSSRLPPKKLPKSQTAAPYGASSKVVTVQSIIPHPTTHLIDETQVSQYSTELKKYVTPTPFAIKQSFMRPYVTEGSTHSLNTSTNLLIYTHSEMFCRPPPGKNITLGTTTARSYAILPQTRLSSFGLSATLSSRGFSTMGACLKSKHPSSSCRSLTNFETRWPACLRVFLSHMRVCTPLRL